MPGYNVLLRNAQLDAITTFAGAGAKLRIYSGTQVATGAALSSNTLLSEDTLGSPFAPAAATASLSPTLPANVTGQTAAGTGTVATWWRIVKADGTTHVIDGTCGTSGTDMTMNTTTISSGVTVAITAFTITRGNA